MRKSYYNTNKECGKTLIDSEEKALTQEELIFYLFASNRNVSLSPFQVQKYLYGEDSKVPITSIRRAMTNLTQKGKLVKQDKMVEGNYGKMTHTWAYKEPEHIQTELF